MLAAANRCAGIWRKRPMQKIPLTVRGAELLKQELQQL
ncbi:TPA: transcription elongation factor GreA, partial [Neisseria gonorrhoeae]